MSVISVAYEAAEKAMADQERRADRATMYGLRAVGRIVKQEARAHAPVYQGSRRMTMRAYRTALAAKPRGGGLVEGNQVVSGLLRSSIHSSRSLRRISGSGYALKIGPRGLRVHLYAGKMEAKYHYMGSGYARGLAEQERVLGAAWSRAMEGAR